MQNTRIKISNVVKNQLPNFVKENYPLVESLFKEYYSGIEYQGSTLDILQNIDKYVKLDNLTNLIETTILRQEISFTDTSIPVRSTAGFPDKYGLIQIDDEVILYKSKTSTSFEECSRGFSGITSYENGLEFQETNSSRHSSSSSVKNLNILFLNEFFKKIKYQFSPGFEDRKFFSSSTLKVNRNLLIKQLKDFYTSKGTDASYRILFKALFGDDVQVIKPRDYLIIPSDAQYRKNQQLVVEAIEGDPKDLENTTIFQNTLTIDGEDFISSAYGTVNKVETVTRKDKTYYVLSLDFDYNKDINLRGSVYGQFVIGPKTRVVEDIVTGSTSISVDTTYGFPEKNGTLVVYYDDNTSQSIPYERKNLNQFLGCSIIRDIEKASDIYLDYVCEGGLTVGQDENPIKFRITGVLSEAVVDPKSRYIVSGNRINLRTLGKDIKEEKFNKFKLNICPSYNVKSVGVQNSQNNIYSVVLYDDHIFYQGDKVTLQTTSGLLRSYDGIVESVLDNYRINVSLPSSFNSSESYVIERNIGKFRFTYNSEIFPESDDVYITDVQNTYRDVDQNLYITSQSLPNYSKERISLSDETVVLGQDFIISEEVNITNPNNLDKILNIGRHSFITGDAVYYQSGLPGNSLNIPNGVYYVKTLGSFNNSTQIKLASSRSNINNNIFVDVGFDASTTRLSGTENKIYKSTNELIFFQNNTSTGEQTTFSRKISPKNIIRKISTPIRPNNKSITPSGTIGVLSNGVEIQNYKSNDFIYYGSIKSIDVKSFGNGYDIINPPILEITDESGIGAQAISHVRGSLDRIDILDGGFDYDGVPEIKISGGNGSNALAVPNMTVFEHSVEFVAESNQVDISTDTITFNLKHKFYEGERVRYDYTDAPIGGLLKDVEYFVSPDSDFVLKIYRTYNEAIDKVNHIQFDEDDLSSGKHYIISANKKSTIGSIKVLRSGKNYTNKKWVFSNNNLDLYRNSIKIDNHGYKTGEIIVYNADETSILGLTTNTEYFVSVIDQNEFRLCEINTDQINPKEYNLTRNIFVNFLDFGTGTYNINYKEIKVEIIGNFKNKSLPKEDIEAKIIPYFIGELFSTAIVNSGSRYGSPTVLNYNRQPNIVVKNGSGCELRPIISNGQIKRVLIVNGGTNYNTTPTIEIDGIGTGAKLIPIISNGRIVDIKVISEGINYDNNGTSLRVVSSGSGAAFDFSIQTWNINSVERLISKNLVTSNDIILYDTKNEFGERITQLTHSYAPRKLRENLLVYRVEGDQTLFKKDLEVDFSGVESETSTTHSPIIGWAYDGNPIYGPFGFTNPNGSGLIKRMESGYSISLSENRPSTDIFPLGLFVEDYQYTGIGDLDEYNGRFCVTPEFPKGIYAYFSTIGGFDNQFSQRYLRPQFPYFIGNEFKSSRIDFNFETTINQNSVSFEELNLIRNTNQYKFLSDTATYNYVFNPIDYEDQLNKVSRTERGIIDGVDVISGGENYCVGDKVEFGEDETGNKSYAEVTEVLGKKINNISVLNTTIENVEFGTSLISNSIIGVCSSPHGLNDNDIISVIGLDELLTNNRKEVSSSIDVFTNQLTLNENILVGTSADNFIPKTIKVLGNLKSTAIRPNDIYTIGDEELKVLNIYPQDSKINVLRTKAGISSHPSGTILIENPRFFEVPTSGDVSSPVLLTDQNYPLNNEIYFDPSVSIGIGTIGDVTSILLEINPLNYQVSISTDALVYGDPNEKLSFVFNNPANSSNFKIGDYVSLTGSTDPSIDNLGTIKVLNVGFGSITVDYNTSSLSLDQLNSIALPNFASYVQKWITREIPIRQIYLPEHKLKTGDKIVYDANDGSSIIVSEDKTNTFELLEPENLYAYVFDANHIGISTDIVGLTSTGEYLNPENNSTLLYFDNPGSRKYHSFKTDYDNVQVGKISKNIARVTTLENPSLFYNERVDIDVKDTSQREIVVKYNDTNRRLIFDPKQFVEADPVNDTIKINNHGYYTGQKVIHNNRIGTIIDASSSIENDKIYYVVVEDDNNFSLAETYNDSISKNPNIIDITITSFGEISSINPPFNLYRNQIVDFILTDESLSFTNNDIKFSAFDFDLYADEQFTEKFIKSENDDSFKVTKTGKIGVENFAKVRLQINDHTPQKLFYKFTLVNTSLNIPETKSQYRVDDDDIKDNSTLFILDSAYSGQKRVYSTGSNYFEYFLRNRPEKNSYTTSNSNISYVTDSYSTTGSISKVSVLSRDRKYRVLPGITSVTTKTGSGALLFPSSEKIGSVKKVDIQNIGFDYSVDYSLRPTGNLPQLINVEPLSIFKDIKVLSIGKNYTLIPDLIVLDGLTNKFDSQSELKFIPDDYEVEIIQNSSGLFNKTPIIVPINNSNGISVRSVSYTPDNKLLTFTLNPSFSSKEDVPFGNGDKVLLENFRVNDIVVDPITNEVTVNENVKGINSENYGYALFTVQDVGETSFTIDMNDYLVGDEIPGDYRPVNSFGYVVPQSYFPTFEVTLQKNNFVIGEEVVTTSGFTGIVEYWDRENEFVSVLSDDKFVTGDRITGKTSNLSGIVGKVQFYDAEYKTNSSSTVARGWDTTTGFLNDKSQRIQDSFYYQYFSYDLKSKTQFSEWDDAVSSLNHVSGFKKFSTFEVESSTETANPVSISYSELNSVSDLISIIDLNSYVNFDMVSENSYLLDGRVTSDQIVFNTIPIQDYAESIGNRVLMIDDFSGEFNNLPREERFVVADRFPIFQTRFRKYFTYVKDKLFFNERQFGIITVIHDNLEGYVSQYGRLDTVGELGNFEFKINGNFGEITFNPFDYEFNDFDIELVSYSLFDTFVGLGSTTQEYYSLGDLVVFNNQTSKIAAGTTATVGISTIDFSYRSSKILVTLNDNNGQFRESVELNVTHDGTEVYISEYGKLYTEPLNPPIGFATYSGVISGSDIIINATPTVSYGSTLEINTFNISIGDITKTSSGILALSNTRLESGFVNIGITTAPTPIQIHEHTLVYGGSYYYISVEDVSNGIYNSLELTTVNNDSDVYQTEFGSVISDDSLVELGTFESEIVGNRCKLFFTPLPGRNLSVRYYYQGVKTITENPETPGELILALNESQINSYTTDYIGTENAIRRSFELYHKNLRILRRVFNASSFTSVNLIEDTIRIPNHYFVTGEEVVYDTNGDDPIGIAATNVPGIGVTTILPSTLYIVKENDLFVRVAASASQALKSVPDYLNLTSYGTGTNHTFTGKKGNPRSLITIDNMIQQPIVPTSFETTISEPVGLKDVRVKVDNPEVFIGGDIFQVDNEILRVKVVGFGATNTLLVNRFWLGSLPGVHTVGAACTKLAGDYNIVDNTIYFYDPPYGPVPFTPTNPKPDEVDFVGIAEGSSFSGRIFNKSGQINGASPTYSDNILLDGLSEEFTGIRSEFGLKENGLPVTGISTSNLFVLVKNILQVPFDEQNNPDGAFTLGQLPGGEATIIFKQTEQVSNLDDINSTNLPASGIIVSTGSTFGAGYQPLRTPGASVTIANDGSISNVTIGSTGSGYRLVGGKEILVTTSSGISSGLNILPINEERGLFDKLAYSSSQTCSVGVGTVYNDIQIIGFNQISSTITLAENLDVDLPADSQVSIKLNDLTTELVDIGIRTESQSDYDVTYLGFTTVINGSISSTLNLVNPGIALTAFYDVFETRASQSVSVGSTVVYVNSIRNINNINNYITINSNFNVKITGIGNTFITVDTPLASIAENDIVTIRRYSPPEIVFDSPVGYSDIPLIYSSDSGSSGIGTGAKLDLVVGADGSVIDFTFKNNGYGYRPFDILTIPIGGLTGIPTDPSKTFSEFKIFVDDVYDTKFSSWSIGDLQVIDNFDDLFDNTRQIFPIKINGDAKSLRAKKGSSIDIQATLLVLFNDILQVPGEGYIFKGGSIIYFPEPPKFGDTVTIVFYRGNGDVDVIDVDVLEPVKVGDSLNIVSDVKRLNQNERIVSEIVSSDYANTLIYSDKGINDDFNFLRPVILSKQTVDAVVDGQFVGKDRVYYESNIFPSAKLISNITGVSTVFYIDSLKPFFDNAAEIIEDKERNKIKIIDQTEKSAARATCQVTDGEVTSINIVDGGEGYVTAPNVSIEYPYFSNPSPIGIALTNIDTLTGTISSTGISTAIIGEFISGQDSGASGILAGITTDNYIEVLPINLNRFQIGEEINLFESGFTADILSVDSTEFATATATISSGSVDLITITNPGTGYTYGSIKELQVISNGSGYPATLNESNSTFTSARLKSKTGIGRNASVDINLIVDPITENFVVDRNNVNITSKGFKYSVGDILEVDVFDNPGIGETFRNYPLTNPFRFEVTQIELPKVSIDPPTTTTEIISDISYASGDFGIVVGVNNNPRVILGNGTDPPAIIFDLYIPEDSILRDEDFIGNTVVGSAITISQLEVGDYFSISNATIGSDIVTNTSYAQNGQIIGVSTNLNSIYQVLTSSIEEINHPKYGIIYINRVTCPVQNLSSDFNGTFGESDIAEFSWGKISNLDKRIFPKEFSVDLTSTQNHPIVQRYNPLKIANYDYSS